MTKQHTHKKGDVVRRKLRHDHHPMRWEVVNTTNHSMRVALLPKRKQEMTTLYPESWEKVK